MTQWEKMMAGEMYDAADPELAELRRRAKELCHQLNHTLDGGERQSLLQELLGRCGDDPWVEPDFHCDYGCNIRVGHRFYANHNCVFLDVCPIEIGDDCLFGPGAMVLTAAHPLDPAQRRAGLEFGKPVFIGDNVWVGAGAILNPRGHRRQQCGDRLRRGGYQRRPGGLHRRRGARQGDPAAVTPAEGLIQA